MNIYIYIHIFYTVWKYSKLWNVDAERDKLLSNKNSLHLYASVRKNDWKKDEMNDPIGNPWMNPDVNLKNIDVVRPITRQVVPAIVAKVARGGTCRLGSSGWKIALWSCTRSPLIAIWRFTFVLAISPEVGVNPPRARIENLLAGDGQEGERGQRGWRVSSGRVERVEEGGCLPSGHIARPSAFDWRCPSIFLFTFLRSSLWGIDHMDELVVWRWRREVFNGYIWMSEREREREFSWLNFLVKSYVYFDGFQVSFFWKI